MTPLKRRLSDLVAGAFEAEGLSRQFGAVTKSNRPDLCQFQCNGAMAAAKAAKANPRDIAARIVQRLSGSFAEASVAGPGFINLTLSRDFLSAHTTELLGDADHGIERASAHTIVIDFGGPNIAKPMHVGHLRSSIIGDALQRICRLKGDVVVSDVHLGDWGKPIGMLITELKCERPDLPYFDPGFIGDYPKDSPVTMDALEELYPRAAKACAADPARDEEARRATADLQAGRRGYRALWHHFVDVSRVGLEREFGALGVIFDLWKGESDVDALIEPMIDDLKARKIAEIDDGATIVRVAADGDKFEMPPLMLKTRDGAATYAATDLATIVARVDAHRPDAMLYVVDQRQHLHLEQVFRAARKANLAAGVTLEHVGFGTMNGPDGKPFKTRAGGVMKLHDLITLMKNAASARLIEAGLAAAYGDEERQRIAVAVGMAALKFADLSTYRLSDYVFDVDRFMQFEGKTGPYLQYAAVRIQSILRKAEDDGAALAAAVISLQSKAEVDLALCLSEIPDIIEDTYEKRAPNILCDHIYALAQGFSRFYNEHHVLSEANQALRGSRLALCRLTLGQLTLVLGLLGIAVPERM